MYQYEDVAFRPVDEDDLELLRRNRNDMSTLLSLGGVDLASSEQQKAWWRGVSLSQREQWHMIIKAETDTPVGILRFQSMDFVNSVCEVGADIFPEFRRQGLGFKAWKMAMEYLFDHLNMHTLYLKVGAFNEAGRKLYAKLGFQETGSVPESIFRHGKYWDNIIMAVTLDQRVKAE